MKAIVRYTDNKVHIKFIFNNIGAIGGKSVAVVMIFSEEVGTTLSKPRVFKDFKSTSSCIFVS